MESNFYLITNIAALEKGEVFHSKRNDDSDCLFPKSTTSASSVSENDLQCRLDSLLSQGTSLLLNEAHVSKLSSTALKSTFINRVACGERHVLFLTSSGFVYSMGSNELG